MKRFIAALLILLTSSLAAPAPVALETTFALRVGQAAALKNTDWTLTFVRVVRDSRCRPPAQCLWVGEAELELRAKRNSERDTFPFSLNTFSKTSAVALRLRVTINTLELPAGNKSASVATFKISQP